MRDIQKYVADIDPNPNLDSDQFFIPSTYTDKQNQKVEYFDNQMQNPGLMTATEIAKDYSWNAAKHDIYQKLEMDLIEE